MASSNDLPEALTDLTSAFGKEGVEIRTDRLTLEDVRTFVSKHVEVLLDSNPALLMSIIYRIDVAEPKVQHVFEEEHGGELAARLTELIIERQLEKVRLRQHYQNDKDDDF